MRNKASIVIIILGAVLIISALLLFMYNRQEDRLAGTEAKTMLSDVVSFIDAQKSLSVNETIDESDEIDTKLPTVEINGYDFVGYIEIPELDIELPVMAQWDYERLKIAPCRQAGSSRSDDLVIAAHNYSSHFGRLNELDIGASVIFTDMDGIVNCYSVAEISKLEPTDVDAVINSEFDLVLYTCTVGGQSRVSVFCNRNTDTQ